MLVRVADFGEFHRGSLPASAFIKFYYLKQILLNNPIILQILLSGFGRRGTTRHKKVSIR
jgi:hypothetical protein